MERKSLIRLFHSLLSELKLMHHKEDIVEAYGVKSTTELTDAQLADAIDYLQSKKSNSSIIEIKYWRSINLRILTDIGVYYTLQGENCRDCWRRVNDFVASSRIAGNEFYNLNVGELKKLSNKLREMREKGYYYKKVSDTIIEEKIDPIIFLCKPKIQS